MEYSNTGSNVIYIYQLKILLYKQFNPRLSIILNYINTFQIIMSTLEGQNLEEGAAGSPSGSLNDTQKKQWLLNSVVRACYTSLSTMSA